ncbi:MAG: thiaminase II [Alphaproteobacteria bacterium]|jgi:thiaminase/transcriptional activator TenA|nr:thiaminase II [Alphaproteobacteria bacterium]
MAPSEAIWNKATPIRQAMLAMPFNVELAAGTLSREAFKRYMLQDAVYLKGYARVLALAAAKAPTSNEILAFSKAAETAIVVERALHAGYLAQFSVSASDVETAEPSPACAAYVNFMLAEASTGSFATLVGAILPCFWVYREVGLSIKGRAAADNFYQAWIDTYSDEAFGAATEQMIAVYDRAHHGAAAFERALMEAAFVRCCQYEWMFWDSAYRGETWPIKA